MTSSGSTENRFRIAVLGAGLIGLSCALRLARAGHDVTLYEAADKPGKGASLAAAGMLGIGAELGGGAASSPPFARLLKAGGEAWADWKPLLETLSGSLIGMREEPTLFCGSGEEGGAICAELARICQLYGIKSELIDGAAAMTLEHGLSSNVQSAVMLADDRQIDAQATVHALWKAALLTGVTFRLSTSVNDLIEKRGRWETPDRDVWDKVVLATGVYSDLHVHRAGQRPMAVLPPVGKVRGQVVVMDAASGADVPSRVLRYPGGYIVPKHDRVVVGATNEWDNEDEVPSDGTSAELMARAAVVWPAAQNWTIRKAIVGFRPGVDDHLPMIGATRFDGIYTAAAHYRNGALLGPITAELILKAIEGRPDPLLVPAFSPERFHRAGGTAAGSSRSVNQS